MYSPIKTDNIWRAWYFIRVIKRGVHVVAAKLYHELCHSWGDNLQLDVIIKPHAPHCWEPILYQHQTPGHLQAQTPLPARHPLHCHPPWARRIRPRLLASRLLAIATCDYSIYYDEIIDSWWLHTSEMLSGIAQAPPWTIIEIRDIPLQNNGVWLYNGYFPK